MSEPEARGPKEYEHDAPLEWRAPSNERALVILVSRQAASQRAAGVPGPAQWQPDWRGTQAPPCRRPGHPILQALAPEVKKHHRLAQELRGRDRRRRRNGYIMVDVAMRRAAEVGLVRADCEGHEIRPAFEVAMHAVDDTRPLFVEHVVDHDDASLGDRRLGRRKVMLRNLGGMTALDAHEAQRAFRRPGQGRTRESH